MDIQITTYGDGAVNVYTSGGTELVTGRRVATVTYDATTGTLRAGQIDITPGVDGVRGLTGGSLAGLYELRNTTIPTLRAELDEYATQLIDRFSSIDGSLTANESGLFVDQAALNGSNDAGGVASRLIVNPKLDTVKGGNASLLISGLGSKGDKVEGAELVNNMLSVIDERMGGKTLYGENLSLNQYVTMMVAGQQQSRATAERAVESIEVSGATIAASRQNLQGVNIDDELQKLLVVEQSYAANAKVLSTVQSMLDELFAAV